MTKQFFYKKVEKQKVKVDGKDEEKEKVYVDSFNLDMVVRSFAIDNKLIILLNDGHEDSQYVQAPKANGKGFEYKKERRYIASEIELYGEDITRYREMLECPTYLKDLGKVEEVTILRTEEASY